MESGSDRKAKAKIYGGEFTVRKLMATRVNPKEAGIMTSLLDVLEATLNPQKSPSSF